MHENDVAHVDERTDALSVSDAHYDDARIWRAGDLCMLSAWYRLHVTLDDVFVDDMGHQRSVYVVTDSRFPTAAQRDTFWRFAELDKHKRAAS